MGSFQFSRILRVEVICVTIIILFKSPSVVPVSTNEYGTSTGAAAFKFVTHPTKRIEEFQKLYPLDHFAAAESYVYANNGLKLQEWSAVNRNGDNNTSSVKTPSNIFGVGEYHEETHIVFENETIYKACVMSDGTKIYIPHGTKCAEARPILDYILVHENEIDDEATGKLRIRRSPKGKDVKFTMKGDDDKTKYKCVMASIKFRSGHLATRRRLMSFPESDEDVLNPVAPLESTIRQKRKAKKHKIKCVCQCPKCEEEQNPVQKGWGLW